MRNLKYLKFTIIELLIVIAILVILISLLNPTLVKMTENAKRVECMNRQNSFINTSLVMSDDNDGMLPTSGKTHSRSMTKWAYAKFLTYIDQASSLTCPSVNFEGKGDKPVKRFNAYYHLGYQYFGNNSWLNRLKRANNPRRNYNIPTRATGDPEATLVADDNSYCS